MLAITIAYTMRVFVPVTVKHMVKPSNKTIGHIVDFNETFCKASDDSTAEIQVNIIILAKTSSVLFQVLDKVFDWGSDDLTIMSSGFFIGYLVGHMPGGVLADLFGGKIVMSASLFGTSFIIMVLPTVIKSSEGGVIVITFMRFVAGVFLGMLFPSAHSIMSQWTPSKDRGKLTGIIFAASQWSIVFNNGGTRRMIFSIENWSTPYYVYGSLGLVYLLVWQLFVASYPGSCRFIDHEEFIYLERELGKNFIRNFIIAYFSRSC